MLTLLYYVVAEAEWAEYAGLVQDRTDDMLGKYQTLLLQDSMVSIHTMPHLVSYYVQCRAARGIVLRLVRTARSVHTVIQEGVT